MGTTFARAVLPGYSEDISRALYYATEPGLGATSAGAAIARYREDITRALYYVIEL